MSSVAKLATGAHVGEVAQEGGGEMKSAKELFGEEHHAFRGDYYFLNTKEARDRFSKLVSKVSDGKKVVITHHGEPRAVLIPVEDFRTLDALAAAGMKDDLDSIASEEGSIEDLQRKFEAVWTERAQSRRKK